MERFILGILLWCNFSGTQMKTDDPVTFLPVEHASFIIKAASGIVYIDPVGSASAYAGVPDPTIILLTDIHRDHLSPELVALLRKETTTVIGPKSVKEKVQGARTMNNGDTLTIGSVTIEALPMYNLTNDRLKFHEKGRGNGYVLTIENKRVYISGDTEDIPEMRNLRNIDYAFVCMNLPYTMSVEQAASAVLEFRPKVVFPYHYRGPDGFSDVGKFKKIVSTDPSITVKLLPWYPATDLDQKKGK